MTAGLAKRQSNLRAQVLCKITNCSSDLQVLNLLLGLLLTDQLFLLAAACGACGCRNGASAVAFALAQVDDWTKP